MVDTSYYVNRSATSVSPVQALVHRSPRLNHLPSDEEVPSRTPHDTVLIMGEREHRFYPLAPHVIQYIKSDRNYLTLHTRVATYITRDCVKRLERILRPYGFIRIERSILLNVNAVAFLQRRGSGTFTFTLMGDDQLRSTATFRETILRTFPLVASRR